MQCGRAVAPPPTTWTRKWVNLWTCRCDFSMRVVFLIDLATVPPDVGVQLCISRVMVALGTIVPAGALRWRCVGWWCEGGCGVGKCEG